jgi:hypothetical protein
MDIDTKTWLYDILNAIIEIENFLADTRKDFLEYQNDLNQKSRRKKCRNYRRGYRENTNPGQLNSTF